MTDLMAPQMERNPGGANMTARLSKLAQQLGERVSDLADRLSPILTSDVQPDPADVAEDPLPTCPMEAELRTSIGKLDRVLDQINDLHRRVDL